MIKRIFTFKNCLFFIFIILSIILTIGHNPWRDEAQVWMMTRDLPDIPSLLSQMRYEGTPPLWHLIIYPFVKLGFPYITLSLIHFLINLSAIYPLIYKSPFNKIIKILLVFNYFLFIEFNIIARSYVITVSCLFWIAYLLKNLLHNKLKIMILMIIMMLSNSLGLIIAFPLCIYYLFLLTKNKVKRKELIRYFLILTIKV